MKVDFATFCYSGDAHRLHQPGQLKKQVDSNDYPFDNVIIVYQKCYPMNYPPFDIGYNIKKTVMADIDEILMRYNIGLIGQYQSPTDKHHNWKPHVVNHLAAISVTDADYIVFADNDCWMVNQPDNPLFNWVDVGISILKRESSVFIVSPNDGEHERMTQRMSQQMFLVKVDDFRNMDFNQPGWDGNVDVPGGPLPEYWAMNEGRMELYCRQVNKYRYVLPSDYRYWHHNRLTSEGMFEIDYSKY